jgi:uncharacterized Zn finger protein
MLARCPYCGSTELVLEVLSEDLVAQSIECSNGCGAALEPIEVEDLRD